MNSKDTESNMQLTQYSTKWGRKKMEVDTRRGLAPGKSATPSSVAGHIFRLRARSQ